MTIRTQIIRGSSPTSRAPMGVGSTVTLAHLTQSPLGMRCL